MDTVLCYSLLHLDAALVPVSTVQRSELLQLPRLSLLIPLVEPWLGQRSRSTEVTHPYRTSSADERFQRFIVSAVTTGENSDTVDGSLGWGLYWELLGLTPTPPVSFIFIR